MLTKKNMCVLSVSCAMFLTALPSSFAATNLIVNGDFSASNESCVPAVTVLPGWTVVSGNVDIGGIDCSPSLSPPKGQKFFLDLTGSYADGPSDVATISQTVTTVVGKKYQLTFYFGGNPQWQLGPYTNDSPLKAMAVYLNGSISGVYSVNTSGVATNNGQWESETICFTATSTSTTVTFESLNGSATNPSDYGPLLTAVALEAVAK